MGRSQLSDKDRYVNGGGNDERSPVQEKRACEGFMEMYGCDRISHLQKLNPRLIASFPP
jgi:hypothetical protein